MLGTVNDKLLTSYCKEQFIIICRWEETAKIQVVGSWLEKSISMLQVPKVKHNSLGTRSNVKLSLLCFMTLSPPFHVLSSPDTTLVDKRLANVMDVGNYIDNYCT